ncbi:MAG: hypothetical protein LJE70_15240 [Chromatiaceae bacterium]|nr:hypothetical protein [Chromatiaceae bacterium]
MIEPQFFEYARQCTVLPHDIETHADRPAETIDVSTQHLALVARKTVSNGIGTIYCKDLYFIEKITANGTGVKAQVNGVPGEWALNCFMLPR